MAFTVLSEGSTLNNIIVSLLVPLKGSEFLPLQSTPNKMTFCHFAINGIEKFCLFLLKNMLKKLASSCFSVRLFEVKTTNIKTEMQIKMQITNNPTKTFPAFECLSFFESV